ncbi:MAG: hypothetical protein C4527_20310 [Candidatus Omnitrophota bacterium]|jgi:WD40 repeat protein|nr:MAG: hypothetical protein C4527_20310 [Candidatus Omnitrophota bacterium]
MNLSILWLFGSIFLCAPHEFNFEKNVVLEQASRVVQKEVRYPLSMLREFEGTFYFLPDGKQGILEKDGHTQLWDISSWSPIKDLSVNLTNISNITQTEYGLIALATLLTNQSEKIVQITDVFTGQIFQKYTQYGDYPRYIDITNDGDRIILLTDDGTKVYETFTRKEIFTYIGACYALAISNDGKSIMILNDWNGAILIDVENQTNIATFTDIYALTSRIRFSASDRYALILSEGLFNKYEHIEGKIQVINIRNKSVMHNLFNRDELISYAEFSLDEKYIVSSSDTNGTLTVWDVQTGEILAKSSHGGRYVYDINFSFDGSKFVLLFDVGYSQIWDFSSFSSSGVQHYPLYR